MGLASELQKTSVSYQEVRMSILPPLLGPEPGLGSRRRSRRDWKKRIAPLFAGLALAIGAQAQSPAPACLPGVREIFDFHVGDVFQYLLIKPGVVPGTRVEIVRKYKVASRNESGFTRTYQFTGMEARSALNGGVIVERSYNTYNETGAYPDTAHSPFNGCPGEIVPMTSEPNLYTRVEGLRGDTSVFRLAGPGLRMKAYGRTLGIWRDTTFLQAIDVEQREAYAEGLGLASGSYGGYPIPPATTSLVGYVKGGDTVGTVSPDSSFWHTLALKSPAAHRTESGGLSHAGEGVTHAYDGKGRRIPAMEARESRRNVVPRFRK